MIGFPKLIISWTDSIIRRLTNEISRKSIKTVPDFKVAQHEVFGWMSTENRSLASSNNRLGWKMLTKPRSHGPEFLFDGDSMKTVRRRIYQYAHLSSFQKLAAAKRKIKIQFTCFLDLAKLACQLFQEKKNRSSQHAGSHSGKGRKLEADRI